MITRIKVTGMHCASCKTLIEDVCRETGGVSACSVDPATGHGTIEHDDRFNFTSFSKEIASLGGYAVEKI